MAEPTLEPDAPVPMPIEAIDKPGKRAPFRVANALSREVAALLGKTDTRFPGAQPVSFVRRHLDELRQHELVCPRLMHIGLH